MHASLPPVASALAAPAPARRGGGLLWVVINELPLNAVRAAGASAACFVMWTLGALVGWTFPGIAHASGAYTFGFFAGMMVLRFILVAKFFSETKGISLEELQKGFGVAANRPGLGSPSTAR